MDVPSDVAGVIEKIHVKKGGTVSAGDVVATVRAEGEGQWRLLRARRQRQAPSRFRIGRAVRLEASRVPAASVSSFEEYGRLCGAAAERR